jgi:hypothetical protein
MRQVLDRLEDSATGRLLPASFHCEVPAAPGAGARTAAILGEEITQRPWAHYDCGGSSALALPTTRPGAGLLKRTWEPTLSVTGAEGFPALQDAGNVLRPYGLQLPAPAAAGGRRAVRAGNESPAGRQRPYQAKVTWQSASGANGWNAPATAPWFENALNAASQAHFGASCGHIGQGGTIPLMGMLSKGFPRRR